MPKKQLQSLFIQLLGIYWLTILLNCIKN